MTRADTEKVDQLRIDLDPQPGTDFADAARAAHELRSVLEDAELVDSRRPAAGAVSMCSCRSSPRTALSKLGMR